LEITNSMLKAHHARSTVTDPADLERRFGSVDRAFACQASSRFDGAHVAIVGLGGVGSWAAEALARSGIGRLTLIDLDHVAQSNINRQVHALTQTLGQAKVIAMSHRIEQINPACQVQAIEEFVDADNTEQLLPVDADVVLDCTDQMSAKVAMILCARARKQEIVVCGAAGGKTDPLSLRQGDLRDSTHDALLASLRTRLRKHHGFPGPQSKRVPRMGVRVLWFEQAAQRPDLAGQQTGRSMPLACAGYGSLVTVTASMGLAAAAQAMALLLGQHQA
jgi:tRNA A37 threonylcarbamoyladenosine dehydratase